MTNDSNRDALENSQFQRILVECLERLERGESLDGELLVREHPQFGEPLKEFLADQAMLKEVASGVRDSLGRSPVRRPTVPLCDETVDSSPRSGSDFSAGETIRYVDEYEILDEIARGGMGVVFKARQRKLRRIVALKMILAGKLADDADVQRFHREAQAAGRLKHPNIVPVHEIGEHEGRHYFTMDFVDGRSLAEEIREESLPARRAAELVRTVAETVQFAHDQGTVHRDLKPANVLLTADGAPHITDFGLAKMLGSVDEESHAELTATGQILGTPSYMSPEQASGKQELVGPASDIYSLGAILYACLTGRAPFVADSPVETLLQVMEKEPVSPRDLNPSVPRDLETICVKCLTKEPQKRYGTAKELAEDLDRFLGGRPVTARPVGRISKTVRWCRRNPAVASLLTLVFVSMLAGTAVSAFYASVANRHAKEEETQRQLAEQSCDEAERERDVADRARQLAQQRGTDLRRQLYMAHMLQALNEWNAGNTAGVRQLLNQHIPEADEDDLRGFEWHWLDRLTNSARLTIDTKAGIIDSDISGDGEFIVSLCHNGLIINRLNDGEFLHHIRGSFSQPGEVQFDSTGQFVAIGQNAVQLWNVEEETMLWEGTIKAKATWVGITSDDQWVVSAHIPASDSDSGTIAVHEFSSGTLIREISIPTSFEAAGISPSGNQIAAACRDQTLRVWNLRSGIELAEWPHGGWVTDMTWSADGRWLTAATNDGKLCRHDSVSGKIVEARQQESNSFFCIDTDITGRLIATAGTRQIAYLFDQTTENPIGEYRGHQSIIQSIQFRPGTRELVSCDYGGIIHVWDTREKQGFVRFQAKERHLLEAAFSPDMKWFGTCEGNRWRKEQKGTIRLHRISDGSPGPILDGHESAIFGFAVTNAHIYSAGHDGKLIEWDLETFQPKRQRAFEQSLTSLAVSASGDRLAVGTAQSKIQILDGRWKESSPVFQFTRTGSENGDWVRDVAITRDGKFVAGRTRDQLKVWDCLTARVVFEVNHISGRGWPIAFSYAGDRLAAAIDGQVRVYDVSTWKVVREFEAHSEEIRGISFHPDGSRLTTRSASGVLKFWETQTWQNVSTLSVSNADRHDLFDPIFSPDGNFLVFGREGDEALLLTTKSPRKQSADAESVQWQAEKFTRRQMWPEALTEYERLIDLEPDAGNSLVEVSSVAAMLPKSDQALERIIAATSRAQEFEESDLTLASRLVLAAQLQPGTDPNPENSLRIAERAWRELEKPTGMPLLYTLFRQGRDAEIVEFREQHHGIGRGWKENRMIHAAALYRLGQLQEASEILDVAVDLYAHGMPSLGRGRFIENGNVLGTIWSQLIWREVSQIALSALTQAIEAAPDDPGLLYHRGLLHRRWHRWPEAFQDLNRARALDPESLDILGATIVSAILAGEFEVASELAGPFLQRIDTPDQREEIWSAARTVSLIPDASCFDELLLEKVRASTVANPSQPWKQIAVVGVVHRLGRLEEAMEELDRIEQAFPDFTATEVLKAGLSFRRGIMLHELGDEDAAAQALKIGEALGRQSAQPPGVFPKKGRHAFVDEIALRKELASMLTNHSNEGG